MLIRVMQLAVLVLAGLLAPAGTLAQEATPVAGEVQQFAEDTYAFVSGGYVSLFNVIDEGVIATEPGSLFEPGRAEAYKSAIASVTDQPVRYLVYSHDHADHSTGGAVSATTATFIARENAVAKIAALGDPNTPVPTISFSEALTLTLGGTSVELLYTGRNHSDNSIVLHHPAERLLFAVDFIPVNALPYQDLPDAYPEEWVASLQWIEENLDFDTLVIERPPVSGTKEHVAQVRMYLEDLMTAVTVARDEGLEENSPEMLEAVRAELEPDYGAWTNFEECLPLNIEGLIRAWSSAGEATPAA